MTMTMLLDYYVIFILCYFLVVLLLCYLVYVIVGRYGCNLYNNIISIEYDTRELTVNSLMTLYILCIL